MYRMRTFVLRGVNTLLALLLVAAGSVQILNPAFEFQLTQGAYPEWARLLIGGLEIGSGVLLLLPRYAWQGAALAGVLMAGAAANLYWQAAFTQALLAGMLFLICGLTAYANHPAATIVRRLRSAADRVYERELEEARRRVTFRSHRPTPHMNGRTLRHTASDSLSNRLAGSNS
jgi:uncharacterized membrane protein YphA (DoxX/SURF4 family)